MKVKVEGVNGVSPITLTCSDTVLAFLLVYEGTEKGQDFSSLSLLLHCLYNKQPWALFPIHVA